MNLDLVRNQYKAYCCNRNCEEAIEASVMVIYDNENLLYCSEKCYQKEVELKRYILDNT